MTPFAGGPALADDWVDCRQPDDPELAISACTKVIESGPGVERLAMGYLARGAAHFIKSDRDSVIVYRKGDPFEKLGLGITGEKPYAELDLALADFDEAIRIKPDQSVAYHVRGLIHRFKGDTLRALDDFEKSIELDPTSEAKAFIADTRRELDRPFSLEPTVEPIRRR